MPRRFALLVLAALFSAVLLSQEDSSSTLKTSTDTLSRTLAECEKLFSDTIITLTEEDFQEVARRLGVEVAAIKAVVDIEAGQSHQGFAAPGKPLINFDLTMFRRFASKRGVNLSRYSKSHAVVFSASRGSQTRAHNRLDAAMSINPHAAIEGTFWGMFQIGGFNWKKCGAESLEDFVAKMSCSERAQLDMFAEFIINAGLLKALREKNWASFARGYNGPGYAKRGYDTRMAQAYARHSRTEQKGSAKG